MHIISLHVGNISRKNRDSLSPWWWTCVNLFEDSFRDLWGRNWPYELLQAVFSLIKVCAGCENSKKLTLKEWFTLIKKSHNLWRKRVNTIGPCILHSSFGGSCSKAYVFWETTSMCVIFVCCTNLCEERCCVSTNEEIKVWNSCTSWYYKEMEIVGLYALCSF